MVPDLKPEDIPPELRPLSNVIFGTLERGGTSVGEYKWGTQFAEDEYYSALATSLYTFIHTAPDAVAIAMLKVVLHLTEQYPLYRIVEAADRDRDDPLIQERFEHAFALLEIDESEC